MPRSYGGGGVFATTNEWTRVLCNWSHWTPKFVSGRIYSSWEASRSDVKRNVAMSTGLSAVTKNIEHLTRDSNSCQVVFDLYEECVETEHLYGAGTCDFFRELRASCSRFKRDPRRQSVVERRKQWEESTQRRATAAGFATMDEYFRDKHSKDPAMCRIAFKLYNECIGKDPTDEVCDVYRLNCWQFRS